MILIPQNCVGTNRFFEHRNRAEEPVERRRDAEVILARVSPAVSWGRLLRGVDYQHFQRASARFQPKTKLFYQGSRPCRTVRIGVFDDTESPGVGYFSGNFRRSSFVIAALFAAFRIVATSLRTGRGGSIGKCWSYPPVHASSGGMSPDLTVYFEP